MKGKKLSMEEVLELKDGTKVVLDTDQDKNILTTKEGSDLIPEDGGYYCITKNLWEMFQRQAYEYLEEPIKDERRNSIMKNAVVRFPNTIKHYCFMTDLDLQTGDIVVCDTAVGVTVATVVRLEEEMSSLATKWIIDKVDMVAHTKRIELESKKKDLKAKMKKRRKKLEDIAVFAILAKEDPEMAELLKEYQEINN